MVTIYDYTGFKPEGEVQKALEFACRHQGIDGVTVVASLNDKLLKKLSRGNIEYEAVLFRSQIGHIYNLYFRSGVGKNQCLEIICHEAVHLGQQERGELSLNPSTGECRWRGERFRADYPYMKRPWEKEAFRVQSDILKKYKAAKKAKKKDINP